MKPATACFLKKVSLLLSALSLAGCSTGMSIPGSISRDSTGNVSGKVTDDSSITSLSDGGITVVSKAQNKSVSTKVSAQALIGVAGCQMEAHDLTTNAVVAVAVTDSTGTYTITGITAGQTYKVSAICGSQTFSSISKADNIAPANKTPELTSPVSTIMAAKIMTAVLTAIESLNSTLTPDVAAAVRAQVVKALDSVIADIKTTIEAAIESGAMTAPSAAQASAVGNSLRQATTAATVGSAVTTYETINPTPASVDQAVNGAKNSVVALADCDNTIAGKSAKTCAQSIAKIFYGSLNMAIAIDKGTASGAFAARFSGGGACDTTNAGLAADFPNASFTNHGSFCIINPIFGRVDRNRGDGRGGDGRATLFTETGYDGAGGTGLITATAAALYNKNKYTLYNLDNIIFSHSSMAPGKIIGMDVHLIASSANYGTAGQLHDNTFKYQDGSGNWVTMGDVLWNVTGTASQYLSHCTSPCHIINQDSNGGNFLIPWQPNASRFDSTSLDADLGTGASQVAALIGQIGIGTPLGTMLAQFGGTIPSVAQLDAFLDEPVAIGNNPTGHARALALYAQPAYYGTTPAQQVGCQDMTSSQVCYGADGTSAYPIVRMDITVDTLTAGSGTSTLAGAEKVHLITAMTKSATGAYFLRPYSDYSGFTGVIGLSKVSDGSMALNELFQERALKVILTPADCTAIGSPSGCAVGEIYNVRLDWSNCGSMTARCPMAALIKTDHFNTAGSFNFASAVHSNYRQTPLHLAGVTDPIWVIGSGDAGGVRPLQVGITPGTTRDAITPGSGNYIAPIMTGCPGSCTISGFYLLDSYGSARTSAQDADAGSSSYTSVGACGLVNGALQCNVPNVVQYPASYFVGLSLDGVSGHTLNVLAGNTYLDNGPFPNANFRCDRQPYFIDGNANGTLDCDPADATKTLSSSLDISFADFNEYQQWFNNPNNTSALKNGVLITRKNGFRFGDPVGAKKLLTTAFDGWLDGAHSLTGTSRLNALQAFGLTYLFFEQRKIDMNTTSMPGLSGYNTTFKMISPLMDSSGDNTANLNAALGNGLLYIYQP